MFLKTIVLISFYLVGISCKSALEGQFPFVVSIRNITSGAHLCAGSLITKEWVLTAAICFLSRYPNSKFIDANRLIVHAQTLQNREVTKPYSSVEKIHGHHLFDVGTNTRYANNVALLKLSPSMEWYQFLSQSSDTFYIGRIDLPKIELRLIGWAYQPMLSTLSRIQITSYRGLNVVKELWHPNGGSIERAGFANKNLSYFDFESVNSYPNSCENTLTSLCASYKSQQENCVFDVGAPLIAKQVMGPELVGMQVSVRRDRCQGIYPEEFLRLEGYTDWVRTTIKDYSQ